MVPDRQKVLRYGSGQTKSVDGRMQLPDGRMDDAKTISLRLRRGIINDIHVQIMRFTCCLNMALNLTVVYMILHGKRCDLADHFVNNFV